MTAPEIRCYSVSKVPLDEDKGLMTYGWSSIYFGTKYCELNDAEVVYLKMALHDKGYRFQEFDPKIGWPGFPQFISVEELHEFAKTK